jgi:LPS O-antigen subunit length determinant protein (WzzB/FepE family)
VNHPQPTEADYGYEDEIDLMELARTLWEGKGWIIGGGGLAGVIALVVALMMPNIYSATVVLAPAAEQDKAAGLASQFGGLAAMAGIDIGGKLGVDKAVLAMETLKSRAFLTEFVHRHDLLVPIMAGKRWDREKGEWIIDTDLYDVATQTWVRDVKPPRTPKPSDWELYKAFSQTVSISQDKKSSIVTLNIEAKSPVAVQQWAEWLVRDINDFLRQKDVDEAKRSIEYLSKQLQQTAVAQMQAVLYQLIEQQTKTAMLAEVREGYVFRVIDPAVVPEEKARPKRSIIIIVAGMGGAMVGALWVLIQAARRKRAEAA